MWPSTRYAVALTLLMGVSVQAEPTNVTAPPVTSATIPTTLAASNGTIPVYTTTTPIGTNASTSIDTIAAAPTTANEPQSPPAKGAMNVLCDFLLGLNATKWDELCNHPWNSAEHPPFSHTPIANSTVGLVNDTGIPSTVPNTAPAAPKKAAPTSTGSSRMSVDSDTTRISATSITVGPSSWVSGVPTTESSSAHTSSYTSQGSTAAPTTLSTSTVGPPVSASAKPPEESPICWADDTGNSRVPC